MTFTYSGINLLRQYLKQNNEDNPEIEDGFKALSKFPWIPHSDKKLAYSTINTLNKIQFTQVDTALYKQYVLILRQAVDFVYVASKLFPARQNNLRDKFMAENCEWIYNYTNQGKMMIWAHNQHIIKAKNSSGYARMGELLAGKYKQNYYAIGFGFNCGYVNQYNYEKKQDEPFELINAIANSTDNVFAKCKYPNFVLDFRSASDDKIIGEFLNQTLSSYNIEGMYLSVSDKNMYFRYVQQKLVSSYDALIFIRQTTASKHYFGLQ